MTAPLTPVLTAYWDQPDSFTMAGYRRALELDPTYAEAHCGIGGVRH